MFAYPLAAIAFAVMSVGRVRVPRLVKLLFGYLMLLFDGWYLASVAGWASSVTEAGGLPVAIAVGWFAGAVLYLLGVTPERRSRTHVTLERVGLLLVAAVLAIPSALVLLFPLAALLAPSAFRDEVDTPIDRPQR